VRRGYDVVDVAGRVRKLAAEDLPPKVIADRLGCSFAYAAKVIREWRADRANQLATEGAIAP
jgi:hypothetical protein